MGIKDLKKNQHEKPPVKDDTEAPVKQARKADEDKLKHQSVIRFTDKELSQLDKMGLVYNGKIDNKRLREFIVSKI